MCVWCVCMHICIYEQKFIMAEIMRMRMFKVLLTSVELKFNKSYENVHWTVFKGQ